MLCSSSRLSTLVRVLTPRQGCGSVVRYGVRALTTRDEDRGRGSGDRSKTECANYDWKTAHKVAPQGGAELSVELKQQLTSRQRRAIYRSKQRGLLELDILLGQWAVRHVPHMTSEHDLRKLEILLDQDSPYLLNWVLNKSKPPPQIDSDFIESLQKFALAGDHIRGR